MSKTFIDSLPESYRKHYQNIVINPKASTVLFETLNKTEEVKDIARKNSNLYKIFGERMFGATTIDKRLHLEIDLFDRDPIINALVRELDMIETCRCVLTAVGEGITTPPAHLVDVQWKQIKFGVPELLVELKEDKEAILEAIQKVKTVFSSETKQVYLKKKDRDDLQSIVKMQKQIANRTLTLHQITYMRMNIGIKPLNKSIIGIRWKQYL